jgi:hypothetical protein
LLPLHLLAQALTDTSYSPSPSRQASIYKILYKILSTIQFPVHVVSRYFVHIPTVIMASKPGWFYKFPWEDLGNYKYVLYLPFAWTVITGNDDTDHWCCHMLTIVALRYVVAQIFLSVSRIHAITKHTRIQDKGISFPQIDREDHWDDYLLLQIYVATAVHHMPYLGYSNFPWYNAKGLMQMVGWHIGPAELVYYWLHRALHHHYLYTRYHSHHHACKFKGWMGGRKGKKFVCEFTTNTHFLCACA